MSSCPAERGLAVQIQVPHSCSLPALGLRFSASFLAFLFRMLKFQKVHPKPNSQNPKPKPLAQHHKPTTWSLKALKPLSLFAARVPPESPSSQTNPTPQTLLNPKP